MTELAPGPASRIVTLLPRNRPTPMAPPMATAPLWKAVRWRSLQFLARRLLEELVVSLRAFAGRLRVFASEMNQRVQPVLCQFKYRALPKS